MGEQRIGAEQPASRGVPVTVLLSGGLDSTACLAFYRDSNSPIDALFIDYGHPAARFERTAAEAVSRAYGIELATVECSGLSATPITNVPGRNGFLYFVALLHGGKRSRLIATGIHAGSPYHDCSVQFFEALDAIVRDETTGCVRIAAPFLHWTKQMIVQFCETRCVPIHLTRSCDSAAAEPCGKCLSCKDKLQLL